MRLIKKKSKKTNKIIDYRKLRSLNISRTSNWVLNPKTWV